MATAKQVSHYAPGVRAKVETPKHPQLGALFKDIAAQYESRPAFSICLPNGFSATLSYGEIDRLSDAFAAYLRDGLKLEAGARVALQVPNSLSTPIAVFGILKAGLVLVNTNPLYTVPEMQHQFKDSGAKALVIMDLFADKIEAAIQGTSIEKIILCSISEFLPPLQRILVNFSLNFVTHQVKKTTLPHLRFGQALEAGKKILAAAPQKLQSYSVGINPQSLAMLQYTGGTTGVAKGAMLSHSNLLWQIEELYELGKDIVLMGQDTLLVPLPLYHIFSFSVHFGMFYRCGCHNVLIPNPRPMSNLKAAFKKFPINWMTGVNTLYAALLNESWFRAEPPRYLRYAIAGGVTLHHSVAQHWKELLGSPVIEGYGLTEASPVVCFNPMGGQVKEDSIGIPIPNTEVRLMDEKNQEVSEGDPGELCVQGPQVMQGYWQHPDESAQVLIDGWLHTGDIAVMDADGYFKIVDRKKDIIIISGFKVFPNEVEDCLANLEGVAESAVIGVPQGDKEELVRAYIVLKTGSSLSYEQIREHCRKSLTSYKVPKEVRFVTDLPKTNVGKILRKDVKAMALQELKSQT